MIKEEGDVDREQNTVARLSRRRGGSFLAMNVVLRREEFHTNITARMLHFGPLCIFHAMLAYVCLAQLIWRSHLFDQLDALHHVWIPRSCVGLATGNARCCFAPAHPGCVVGCADDCMSAPSPATHETMKH